jgi:dihydrofolate reductase
LVWREALIVDPYRLQQQLLQLTIFRVQTPKKDFHRIDQFFVAYLQLPPALGGQCDTVATVVGLVLGPPPPRPEARRDFAAQATACGNFIVGLKTFEGFAANGPNPAFAGLDIVVVSSRLVGVPGVTWAATPSQALRHLEERGHKAALLSGGARLHNSFLASGLVDEAVLNIAPFLEGEGLRIHLAAGPHRNVTLLGVEELGAGVTQLRYSLRT